MGFNWVDVNEVYDGFWSYFASTPQVFERCGAIIFVIDAQDDWNDAIAKFTQTVSRANAVNPKIKYVQ